MTFYNAIVNHPKAEKRHVAIHYKAVTGHLIAASQTQTLIIFPLRAELGTEKQLALRGVL